VAATLSPTAPSGPCSYPGCTILVPKGRCPQHTQDHDRSRRPAWVTTFYSSTAWKKLRALKRQLNPFCEDCQARGIGTPVHDVDHVIPLTTRPDLGLVLENLRSLCRACHAAKTRRGGGSIL